jgi:hypothetical protein
VYNFEKNLSQNVTKNSNKKQTNLLSQTELDSFQKENFSNRQKSKNKSKKKLQKESKIESDQQSNQKTANSYFKK